MSYDLELCKKFFRYNLISCHFMEPSNHHSLTMQIVTATRKVINNHDNLLSRSPVGLISQIAIRDQ